MRLHDRVAVVTGAGSGIGSTIARTLAREGARVVVGDLNLAAAEEVAREIERTGRDARARSVDVAHSASVDALAETAAEWAGRLDIWVNNAGVVLQKLVVDTSDVEWARVLEVNLYGPFYGSRAAARTMLRQGTGGRIIGISSIMARQTRPLNGAYTAAKAGLEGLTRALALELAPHAITVNAVAPGHVDTPLTRPMFTPNVRRAFEERIPLGRVGEPEWIADAVLFLASDDARYVTGQVLLVDGGYAINGDLPGLEFGPNPG